MAKCTFCGKQIPNGTGKMFIYATGKVDYYCSHRCETVLHKLKRKPLQTKWTETYAQNKAKSKSEKKTA